MSAATVFVFLLAWLALAASADARRSDVFERFGVVELAEGQAAPDFALRDLDGREVRLSEHRGKVVVINFWATWCTTCEWEMPVMQAFYDALRSEPFVLLAISIDRAEPKYVRAYVEGKRLTFPVLLDPDSRVMRSYRARALPTTFFVNPRGELRGAIFGPRDWTVEEARAVVRHLMNEGAARGSERRGH